MEIQKIKELARKLNLQNIYYGEIELKETGLQLGLFVLYSQ